MPIECSQCNWRAPQVGDRGQVLLTVFLSRALEELPGCLREGRLDADFSVNSGGELEILDHVREAKHRGLIPAFHVIAAASVQVWREAGQHLPHPLSIDAGAKAGIVEFAGCSADDAQHAVRDQLQPGRRAQRTNVTNIADCLEDMASSLEGGGVATNHDE